MVSEATVASVTEVGAIVTEVVPAGPDDGVIVYPRGTDAVHALAAVTSPVTDEEAWGNVQDAGSDACTVFLAAQSGTSNCTVP